MKVDQSPEKLPTSVATSISQWFFVLSACVVVPFLLQHSFLSLLCLLNELDPAVKKNVTSVTFGQ